MSIELRQTCYACPEQYDAFHNGEMVGYLRLRHGFFYVQCPDSGGDDVYEADTEGDGMFEPHERERHLEGAKDAIMRWLQGRKSHPKP